MWGLFVQNHAIACSMYADIAVLYVHPVNDINQKSIEITITEEPFLTIKVYYPNTIFAKIPLLNLLFKLFYFFKAYKIGFNQIQKHFGDYNIIHANILTRTAFIAYFKKLFAGKNYIITEHWSRYLSNVGTYKGFFRKMLTKIVVKHADSVTTVTENLKNAMQAQQLMNNNYEVVPNVVNSDLFALAEMNSAPIKRILHVSCFEDCSKNISGLLRVCRRLQEYRNDFKLIMVGDGIDKTVMEQYAVELGFSTERIEFLGLLTGKSLVEQFQMSAFFVMFSNYENFPVVLAESLICGRPVVATKVGGIQEFVDGSNGKLVEAKDESALEGVIVEMLDCYSKYDGLAIRNEAVLKFSQQAVGKQFHDIYSEVIRKNKPC